VAFADHPFVVLVATMLYQKYFVVVVVVVVNKNKNIL